MCDYSLHLVANRPARVGDELVSTRFRNPLTRRFCRNRRAGRGRLPATRDRSLRSKRDVERDAAFRFFRGRSLKQTVARFPAGQS